MAKIHIQEVHNINGSSVIPPKAVCGSIYVETTSSQEDVTCIKCQKWLDRRGELPSVRHPNNIVRIAGYAKN